MNLYLLAALLSGVFYSINGVLYKISNKYSIRDPLRLLFYIYFLQLPLSLLILPFVKFSFIRQDLFSFLFFNLAFFVGSIFVGFSLVHLDASVFMPLFNLQLILTGSLAYFALGERYSTVSYLFMVVIVLGGVLVSAEDKFQLKISKPLILLLIGLLFYSLSDIFGGIAVRKLGVLNLRFWSSIFLFILSILLVPFFKVNEKIIPSKLVPPFFVGFFGFLGLIFLSLGFIYSVSLSQALGRLSSVYSLILIIVLAKYRGEFLEKYSRKVYITRFVGCLIMVVAALGLVLTK